MLTITTFHAKSQNYIGSAKKLLLLAFTETRILGMARIFCGAQFLNNSTPRRDVVMIIVGGVQ